MTAPDGALQGAAAPSAAGSAAEGRALARTAAVAALVSFALAVAWFASLRNALLFLIGAGLGTSLVLFGIGFAGPWRAFKVRREARGFVATLLLLALATVVFIPALEAIDGVVSNAAPFGVSVLAGAFLFGIGMQLGGGCGSGTIVGAGTGSRHSLWVLLFFLPGSVVGTLHLPMWLGAPNMGQVVLADHLPVPVAALLQVAALAALAFAAVSIAKRSGSTASWRPTNRQVAGCAVIVLLALLSLYVSGRMWSITFAYGLWGAKVLDMAGTGISETVFWSSPYPANALANSVLADVTSVMNFGMLAGVAALTVWRWRKTDDLAPGSARGFAAAALAGLLMGYGARLAFGCNIGALFSGLASGSMHAWLWFAAAWAGSHLGVRLRPRFGLAN